MRERMKAWVYNEDDNAVYQPKGDGTLDTVAIPQSGRLSVQERTANGYLIAASPDLLESLKGILAITDRNHVAWEAARAAIARAEKGKE